MKHCLLRRPPRPLPAPVLALFLAWPLAAPLAQAQQVCPPGLAQATPSAHFEDAGPGMVRHKPSGLVWKRCAEGQQWNGATCTGAAAVYTWPQAFERAEAVNAGASGTHNGGHADWRVPNINELKSIVEEACYGPAINATPFPATPSGGFWSSSPIAGDPDYAWGVDFDYGVDYWYDRDYALRLRLVRAGQSFLDFDAFKAPPPPPPAVTAVPALGGWGLGLLSALASLAAGLGLRRMGRRGREA